MGIQFDKTVEYVFACFFADSDAGICYGYIYLIFFQSVIQFDFAIGCEFDCIGQEIGDYLCVSRFGSELSLTEGKSRLKEKRT